MSGIFTKNKKQKKEDKLDNDIELSRDTYFLENRVLWLEGQINEESVSDILKYLVYWNANSGKRVCIFINSEGGDTTSGMAVVDAIDCLKDCGIEVWTVACGECSSMASIILANGTEGARFCTKNSRVMIHNSYYDDIDGHIDSIDICKKELTVTNEAFSKILARHSSKTASWFTKKLEKDYYMSAEEARKVGIVDVIGFPKL